MRGEIKAKSIYEYQKKQKHKIAALLVSVSIILGMALLFTPVRRVVAMGVERVFIYIGEYTRGHIESKAPKVDGLQVDAIEVAGFKDYQYITRNAQDVHLGELILVNGKNACHCLQGSDLVRVRQFKGDSYKIQSNQIQLNKEMLQHMNYMLDTFEECTGKHDIILTSGYRTLKEQEEILLEKINLLGEEDALRWAMLPGYSEHHTGYAVDISIYTDQGNYIKYKGQDEYGWINENCYKYGFIRRYAGDKKEITGVANEEWHYRYIGVPHAYIVTAKGFCFEEYIEYLRQFTYDNKHLLIDCNQNQYEIYFVRSMGKETNIPVPVGKVYSVSGNNVDGFIVTVEK